MNFFKKHWFKILLLLPFIPTGVLIYYLDQFVGIDASLRLMAAILLTSGTLFLFVFGLYLELNKGAFDQKRFVFNIKNTTFGVTEIARLVFSLIIILACISVVRIASISMRLDAFLTAVTVDVPEEVEVQELPEEQMVEEVFVENTYSLVIMADFDITSQRGYSRVGVISLTNDAKDVATDVFLDEQNFIINPLRTPFDSPFDLIEALYRFDVDAIIIESNFVQLVDEFEDFAYIVDETTVLTQFTVEKEVAPRVEMTPGEPFSILLLGLDTPDDGDLVGGRFDTVMLLTINLENLSFTLVSIPRDSWLPIPHWNFRVDKLAHTGGCAPCAVGAVEHLLNMDIPYYAVVNFNGVLDVVEVLDGVTIDVPFSFSEQNSQNRFGNHLIHVEAGLQRLNGEEVLALARHRYTLTNHDFGRAESGQLVMEALVREMLSSMTSLSDALPILEVLGRNIQTNFTRHELIGLAQYMLEYLPQLRHIDLMSEIHFNQMVILGDTPTINGMAVILPWPSHIAQARQLMMINLGIEEPDMSFTFSFNGFDRQTRNWVISGGYGSGILPPGEVIDEEEPIETEDLPEEIPELPPVETLPEQPIPEQQLPEEEWLPEADETPDFEPEEVDPPQEQTPDEPASTPADGDGE